MPAISVLLKFNEDRPSPQEAVQFFFNRPFIVNYEIQIGDLINTGSDSYRLIAVQCNTVDDHTQTDIFHQLLTSGILAGNRINIISMDNPARNYDLSQLQNENYQNFVCRP